MKSLFKNLKAIAQPQDKSCVKFPRLLTSLLLSSTIFTGTSLSLAFSLSILGYALPAAAGGTTYCQSPYGEVYGTVTPKSLHVIHGATGASAILTTSTFNVAAINGMATDHVNKLVYYGDGNNLYAWNALTNQHILITNNFSSFIPSSYTHTFTTLSSGGAAFYNGSLYVGVDGRTTAGINPNFEIFKIDFVTASNGTTIQTVTPLNVVDNSGGGLVRTNEDWGDFIISDTGIILALTTQSGAAHLWNYNLNTNQYTNIGFPTGGNHQFAKSGDGKIWALFSSGNVQEILFNGTYTGTTKPTISVSDGGECVVGNATVGDRVWDDVNGNGIQDVGEPGIAGVSVSIYRDINKDGVLAATDPQLATQTTDANGNYNFTELLPHDPLTGTGHNDFIIQITGGVPTGYTATTATRQTVDLSSATQTITTVDFGYKPPAVSVSGTLYEDTDGGDDFDSGETTLPANITVKLLDSGNNVVATTTTTASGAYTFTNVINGSYKIQVDTSDTDITAGYTLGTPNDTAITVSGVNVSNINFGFDQPVSPPSGSASCQSPYNEIYSGQSGNKIFAVHGPTGATIELTGSAIAGTVNSLASDHNNHLVYYAEGTSVYAWDAINNTHITITNNIRSFNSSLPTNSTLLSLGGAAFYNGSLYLGVDPPSAGIFEIYKVNFVPGSNGRTIQSVTPLNINGAGKANGQLNDGDWGDFIINDNGVIYGSSGGTAKYWSFDLNTNTFTDLVDNIPQSSQLAKDGTGRLWAFRNGTNSVVQIEIVGNTIQTVGTANSTSPHSSADAGECVTGLSSIGDRVFNDADGDGVEDAGEGGFANVTVALYRDINGDGVINATDPQLAIQTTDANGNYDFTGLIFGKYIVKVTDTNQVLTGKTITTGTNTKAVNLPTGIQNYKNADFGFNQPVPSNPNVLLVKRITAINGSSFTNLIDGVKDANSPYYVPEPHDTDDNNGNWANNYLLGLLNGGTVRPNDEVEYTIYFLSAGDTTAKNVLICDRIPENATFIPTAFNSFATKNTTGLPTGDRGIIWQNNGATESLTNISDDDTAEYLSPGVDPTIKYPGIKCDGTNTNGVVVVNLGNLPNAIAPGTPVNSYGFIRFRGRVK